MLLCCIWIDADEERENDMWIAAFILFLLSAIALFIRFHALKKRQHLSGIQEQSPKAIINMHQKLSQELGELNELVCVVGNWYCPSPVHTPWKKTACLYYKANQDREYEESYQERDQQNRVVNRTRIDRDRILTQEQAADFVIHEQELQIQIQPQNASFEPLTKSYAHFEPVMNHFSHFLIAQKKVLGDRYEEYTFQPSEHQKLTVIGSLQKSGEGFSIVQNENLWIITTKSRKDLIKESSRWAFWSGWISLILLMIAVICTVIASIQAL
jgi:hypothetical protein